MDREFYKRGKVWARECWITVGLSNFGLGFHSHNKRRLHNLQISFLFFDFYVSFYRGKR